MQRYNGQYQHNQIMTASPGQLLLLTYRGILRFLSEAAEAMEREDLYAQSTAIVKAQDLLRYLADTLNYEADPLLAGNLERIYRYLMNRLTRANVKNDREALQEVIQLLVECQSAWEEAEALARGVPPLSMMSAAHLASAGRAVLAGGHR
jgi:flagellar protein FliS